jgi:hypothetical protein
VEEKFKRALEALMKALGDTPIMEECPECNATGVVEGPTAFVSICANCEGACYIDHFCWEQEDE